jgi:hypothetical protein
MQLPAHAFLPFRGDPMRDDRAAHFDFDTGAAAPPAGTARSRYLLQQLGLSHDPFLHSVAEQEIEHQPNQFYVYSADIQADLLAQLLQPSHTVILAPPGGGKTTLRLNLAYQLRCHRPGILPVTYQLTDITAFEPEHAEANLRREFAKDLLISLLRQEKITQPSPVAPGSASARLIAGLLHQQPYRRAFERLLQMPDSRPLNSLWGALGRAGTPPLAWTSVAVRRLAASLLDLSYDPQQPASFADLPVALQEGGFTHMYLLLDSIDAIERSPEQIAQILQQISGWAASNAPWLVLKLFLPGEIEPLLPACTQALRGRPPLQQIQIRWTDEQLEEVLLQRLRAAHSDFGSVRDLFARHEADAISRELIHAAQGSPRELFRLFSAVIDAHIARNAPSLALGYADWQAGCRTTSFSSF